MGSDIGWRVLITRSITAGVWLTYRVPAPRGCGSLANWEPALSTDCRHMRVDPISALPSAKPLLGDNGSEAQRNRSCIEIKKGQNNFKKLQEMMTQQLLIQAPPSPQTDNKIFILENKENGLPGISGLSS